MKATKFVNLHVFRSINVFEGITLVREELFSFELKIKN